MKRAIENFANKNPGTTIIIGISLVLVVFACIFRLAVKDTWEISEAKDALRQQFVEESKDALRMMKLGERKVVTIKAIYANDAEQLIMDASQRGYALTEMTDFVYTYERDGNFYHFHYSILSSIKAEYYRKD